MIATLSLFRIWSVTADFFCLANRGIYGILRFILMELLLGSVYPLDVQRACDLGHGGVDLDRNHYLVGHSHQLRVDHSHQLLVDHQSHHLEDQHGQNPYLEDHHDRRNHRHLEDRRIHHHLEAHHDQSPYQEHHHGQSPYQEHHRSHHLED